jgi:Photosynthetic reaction centre cytochrome C subunit
MTKISIFTTLAFCGTALYAQPGGGRPRQPLPNMQVIAESLGVQCEFCHSAQGSGAPEPKKDIARQMMAMTREINTRVDTATGAAAGSAARVDCVTCHRGVPIPKPLAEIVAQTIVKEGAAAAIAQYRDLRKQFYGRAAYDFGENTLITVSQRIANSKPNDAIELMKLNTELFPTSSQSWAALAYAYTRKVDDTSAMAALEKAVELDPTNSVARGQLEQLQSYHRR